jgi:DNA-binding MarR family transcriptional regulator
MDAESQPVRPGRSRGAPPSAAEAESACTEACSDSAARAWVQLIRAHRSALCSVEKALRSADLPPLEWYDVLLELERGGPLRPRDLQDRLLLAQYNLSRLLTRMHSEGLVEREGCSEDARCQWVKATGAGLALRKRMWPVYAAAIRQAIGARLSDAQAERLANLLGRMSSCPQATASAR